MFYPSYKEGIYLEHTDGHDKWWALIPNGRGEWEAWYGARGRIHPKSSIYSGNQAYNKYIEKIGKGYEERGRVFKYQDLVFIQEKISQLGEDGYKAFKESRGIGSKTKAKKEVGPGFDFMAELRSI